MVARLRLLAGAGSLMLVSLALASPALASAGKPAGPADGVPPPAQRIAATTATFNAIEAKIAAGQSLRLRFPDPTAQEDIIDYGVNGLWQTGHRRRGRDRGLHRHQPGPEPRGVDDELRHADGPAAGEHHRHGAARAD